MSGETPDKFKALAKKRCGPAPDFSKLIAGLESQLQASPADDSERAAKIIKTPAGKSAMPVPAGKAVIPVPAGKAAMPVPMSAAAQAIAKITSQASQSPPAEPAIAPAFGTLSALITSKAASQPPPAKQEIAPSVGKRASKWDTLPPIPSKSSGPPPGGELLTTGELEKLFSADSTEPAMPAQPEATPFALPIESLDVAQIAEATPSMSAVALPAQADGNGEDAGLSENDAKMAQWSQILGMMTQLGLNERAAEYLQTLTELQEASEEYLKRYTETVVAMDQLFNTAHREAMQALAAGQMQAPIAAGLGIVAPADKAAGKRLPRRHGMPPCKFYMNTGGCAYGPSCKWDHPDRKMTSPGAA
eukprot:TRINITY_DN9108_c0_g3_i1.p1 TRINITY_DN9108_c0_g3~~TRINITY_DN9108_c0_g3_i1.p1  ORF type:complete len:377 (-),score=77.56 TRINITY_DN9108_c0_g3_i1:22-1104(-)